MRALLLAAGHGTRLRPVTDTVPKCLVTINGRTLLERWVEALLEAGVERVLINTHYLSEAVTAFVEGRPFRDRIDLRHEPELLGTGGTIAANAGFFQGEPGLVLHSDNLSDLDIAAFADAHARRAPGVAMTMATFRTDAPQACGIVEHDARDIVIAFHEKVPDPPGDLANAAAYVMEPEVIALCRQRGRTGLDLSTEIIPDLVGRIQIYRHAGYHRDIGSIESLRRGRADFGDPEPVPGP